MNYRSMKIQDQVIVITGASSGIGRRTAVLAGERGARVVLGARSMKDLEEVRDEIISKGGKAIAVEMDVSEIKDIIKLKDEALNAFGEINTWINNAGVAIYGYLLDENIEDERKLFETNFWGARNGSDIAVKAMKEKGGVLINLGSEVSVAAQPLLGMYSSSKHALKAFTDALRCELRDRKIPVEVCLIRPTAIDTPFADHAGNQLDEGSPSLPSPMYSPDVAAEAILRCAENPQRDVYVGGPARLSALLDTFFPKVKDMMAEARMKELKKGTEETHKEPKENLHHESSENAVHGSSEGIQLHHSLYTYLTSSPVFRTLKKSIKTSFNEISKEGRH